MYYIIIYILYYEYIIITFTFPGLAFEMTHIVHLHFRSHPPPRRSQIATRKIKFLTTHSPLIFAHSSLFDPPSPPRKKIKKIPSKATVLYT